MHRTSTAVRAKCEHDRLLRALAAGLRIVEVASFESPRIHGDSHLRTFRDGSRVLRTIARERRRLSRARAGLGVPRPAPRQGVTVVAAGAPEPAVPRLVVTPTGQQPMLTEADSR